MTNQKRRLIATIYVFGFMLAFAVSGTMFYSVLPKIQESYNLSAEQASLFSLFSSGASIASSFIVAGLVDRLDKNRLLGIMVIVTGIFLFGMGSMPPFALLIGLYVVMSLFSMVLDTACAAYISDLYGDERSKYVSILHAFYGLGSLLGPLFVGRLFDWGFTWSTNYKSLGIFFVAIGIIFIVTMLIVKRPVPVVQNVDESGKRMKTPYKAMFKSAPLMILCVVSFLYSGFMLYNLWFQTYLYRSDPVTYTVSVYTSIYSMYPIGMIISRLANSFISKYISPRKYIMLTSIVSAAALAAGILINTVVTWYIVTAILGLLTGAIYTAKFVLACEYFPLFPASATAFTGLASALGSLAFAFVVNRISDHLDWVMWIAVAVLVLTFVLLLFTGSLSTPDAENTEAVGEVKKMSE